MLRVLTLFTPLIVVITFVGCTPRKVAVSGEQKPDTLQVEQPNEEPPTPSEKVAPQEEEEEEYPALPEGYKRILGFRVHVFKGSYEEAKRVMRELKATTPLKVHLVKDPPYYEVEVGDFLTRDMAESVMKILLMKGYPESIVVETLVETR